MIDEQTQDLVLRYLLGELDASQMENVRAQIESDPELRTFANEMEETLGSLAYAAKPIAAPPIFRSAYCGQREDRCSSPQRRRGQGTSLLIFYLGHWRHALRSRVSSLDWTVNGYGQDFRKNWPRFGKPMRRPAIR